MVAVISVDLSTVMEQVVDPELFGLCARDTNVYDHCRDPLLRATANKYPTPLLRHNWVDYQMGLIFPSRRNAPDAPVWGTGAGNVDGFLDQFRNFNGWLKNGTARQVWTLGYPAWLNIKSPADQALYGRMAVTVARHFAAKGLPMTWVELANEPDKEDAVALSGLFNAMATALHAYDPAIQCGGLSDSWYHGGARMDTFFSRTKQNLQFVTWHQYPSSGSDGMSAQDAVNTAISGLITTARAARAQASANGIAATVPLALTEYNLDYGNYKDPLNHNLAGAVAAAGVTYAMVTANVNATMGALWETANDSAYAVFGNAPDYHGGRIYPTGLALSWLGQYMPGQLVKTTWPSDTPLLVGYATRTASGFAVAVINTDLSNGYRVDLSQNGFSDVGWHEISNRFQNGTVHTVPAASLADLDIPASSIVIITGTAGTGRDRAGTPAAHGPDQHD